MRALKGETHCFVCEGMNPLIAVLWNIVDILLACTDTKLPPIPLIMG